ncbi:GMC oxidoreductase [Streptomyces sp. NPDC020362]|uniref:GMC oxidoreductase n=1 Tax=unclassified Streptomyces TaxID=2593676 RepID=UPI0033E46470
MKPATGTSRTVIVGGGLAGLELARQLETYGAGDVLVLEAGSRTELRHVNMTESGEDALRLWLAPDTDSTFRRPWTSLTPPHYTGASGVRRRLGGRSLYWYGVTLPLEDWALAEPHWPRRVVRDLTESWQGGAPLYDRVGQELRAWQGTDGTGEHTEVEFAGTALRPTPRARRPSRDRSGRWYAYSPLDAWRDGETGTGTREPEGIRFLTGVTAVRVKVENGVCRGVVIRPTEPESGPETDIAADRVVLCAGTVESTRLAIQALVDADGSRRPRLGRLADHIVQGVFLRLEGDEAARLVKALPPGSYMAHGPQEARSNLFVDVHLRPHGDVLLEVRAMGEQMPCDESYVECVPGPTYPWPVRVSSAPSVHDRELLTRQQHLLTEYLAAVCELLGIPAAPLSFADYDRPDRGNDCALPEAVDAMAVNTPVTWCNSVGTEDHEGGTLPLGDILDDDHQFHAVRGLHAAGPATFPRLGAANPSLTTLALVHRLARKLAQPGAASRAGSAPCA